MKQLKPWLLLAGVTMVLAACGGGGESTPSPEPVSPLDGLPAEATQSISGWLDYIDRLSKASGANGREAVDLSSIASITIPVDDFSEPVALSP